MDFDLSSDQVALLDAASGFLDDRCASRHVRSAADHGGFDLSLWTLMVDQGWIGITTSESAGGCLLLLRRPDWETDWSQCAWLWSRLEW